MPNKQVQSLSAERVSFRAILIASILIPINSYWVIEMEVIRYSGHPVTISLFFNVIFVISVLLGFNLFLRKLSPRLTLKQGELITIYTMLSIASGVAGHDMLEILLPMLGHAFWFATPENEWKDLFWNYLPRWLTVSDKAALKGYYRGGELYTLYQLKNWGVPILWWTTFVTVLVFVMLCINVILRKQWTERERLSYPIIQLPLEMTRGDFRLFRNHLLWIGFAIAAILDTLNQLHTMYPGIPAIRTRVKNYGYLFTEKPWNAMGGLPISFYPFAIGLGFFIPLDLSFSCWFFFWYWKALRIIGAAIGLRLPGFPLMNEQASGGYIALALIALWISRKHIIRALRKAFGVGEIDDSEEPMSYRTAVLGAILGFSFIVFFCYRGGMSVWVAVLFFIFYFAISLAVTRMRAELGTPVHDLHYSGPDMILVRSLGTRRLGKGNLTMFSMFWFITRAYRSHPMPHQLEGFKLAERTGLGSRRLAFAMMLAAVLGAISAFWAQLDRGFRIGMEIKAPWPALTAFGREPYDRLARWLNFPSGTNVPATIAMVIGFAMTLLLMGMRMRFFWWPFHPAGFAITTSWGMNMVWSCLFISWLVKWIILKYGGLKVHRKATPFFLGLILGEFTMGSIWNIFGIILNVPIYHFWG
ncbi:hypothetical protein J7M22_07060 [Candidatus Poribacteria bacterium]|nr:hypothetical protein [Candidatus Poribacteria bacterium]